LAFALNLLDDSTRHNLDIIRRVRNVFAHAAKAVSFSTHLIAAECRKLLLDDIRAGDQKAPIARRRFQLACAAAGQKFVAVALQISSQTKSE